MSKSRLLVVTATDNDLLQFFQRLEPELTVIRPDEILTEDLDSFHAFALLGGVSDSPLFFSADQRAAIETQIAKGKKIFAEYVTSIGNVYSEPPESTRFQRLVFCTKDVSDSELSPGMLLDDQCGMRIKPHPFTCSDREPILQYSTVHAHDRTILEEGFFSKKSDRALWFETPENLLVCAFRLANFIRARFAPQKRIFELVSFIGTWLTGKALSYEEMKFAYSSGFATGDPYSEKRIRRSADRAMKWLKDSGMLPDEGLTGVLEGLGTEIYPDGNQRISKVQRADCIGEVALSYYLQGRLDSDPKNTMVSERLHNYIFNYYLVRDGGPLHGMMRWSNEAWGICYQDDVARAVIPQLLKCLISREKTYLEESVEALEFLIRTTGIDGTRLFRTDNMHL